MGLRFPGPDDVGGAAALVRDASTAQGYPAQIDVSPGSIRFRNTVPVVDDQDGQDGKPDEPGTKQAITGWTVKSRRQMLRTFASLDYGPMYEGDRIPVRVTLSYPDDWQTVAPDGAAVDRHFDMFARRWARAWGEPLICAWKREFQQREAPHLHFTARGTRGLAGATRQAYYVAALHRWEEIGRTELALMEARGGVLKPGVDRVKVERDISRAHLPCPRNRPVYGDGLGLRQWVAETWADIVAHPDPEQREKHRKAGTRVDIEPVLEYRDPKRLAVYFSKHGTWSSKEYQNRPPAEWLAAGKPVGRFWGYRGLSPLVEPAQVARPDYELARRTMRRWAARRRVWDETTRRYRWVGAGKSVMVVQRRKDPETGERRLMPVKVWGPRGRLRGKSGTLCVNDGPAMARQLARLMYLARQVDPLAEKQAVQVAADQARALSVLVAAGLLTGPPTSAQPRVRPPEVADQFVLFGVA